MCYVYYLYSEKINKFYIGKSVDILNRLEEHNRGKEKYTKKGVPWRLVGYIQCDTNLEASKLEQKMKKAKNPKYVRWYIEQNGIIAD